MTLAASDNTIALETALAAGTLQRAKLPLHVAAQVGASAAAVAALLRAFPHGAAQQDVQRRLALHCAAQAGLEPATLQALRAANPSAAVQKDVGGRTPLALAFVRKTAGFLLGDRRGGQRPRSASLPAGCNHYLEPWLLAAHGSWLHALRKSFRSCHSSVTALSL